MKEFKLYVKGEHTTTLISKFDNWSQDYAQPLSSVYDEHLDEAENDQYTLTFSAASHLPTHDEDGNPVLVPNYFLKLLNIGQELRLEIDYGEKIIDFVIASRTPTFNKNTTTFAFTAQDVVSYRWARMNKGYTYSSFDRTKLYSDTLIPKLIEEMVMEICDDNFLSDWLIRSPQKDENYLYGQKCIAEEIGDSPYNSIIEVCNLFQAQLRVDFFKKELSFYAKADRKFSGYRYRCDTNVKTLSQDENGDEFATLLRVTGGTDETGAEIPIVPAIPDCLEPVLTAHMGDITGGEIDFSDGFYWREEFNNEKKWLETHSNATIDEWIHSYIVEGSAWPEAPLVLEWLQRYYHERPAEDQSFNEIFEADMAPKDNSLYNGNELVPTLRAFLAIANEVPYLDQYLLDWSYFTNLDYMSKTTEKALKEFYHKVLPQYNIRLKLLTTTYYTLMYEVASIETELKVQAEAYIANCKTLITDVAKAEDVQMETAKIQAAMDEILRRNNYCYFRYLSILYGGQEQIKAYLKELYVDKKNSYMDLFNEAQKEYDKFSALVKDPNSTTGADQVIDTTNIDYTLITNLSKKEYWKNKLDLYKSLCKGWTSKPDGFEAPCLYDLLNNTTIRALSKAGNLPIQKQNSSLESQTTSLRKEINAKLKVLYNNYSRYLIEATYENTEETNSISLFNQAKVHMINVNKPVRNYNLSTINLYDMERIAVPALSVGHVIKVEDPYEEDMKDITITNLSYNMRLPDSVSITVENISKYKNTLYKLIKSVQ